MSSDSHIRSRNELPRTNTNTALYADARPPPDLRQAYDLARSLLRGNPQAVAGRSGHFVVCVRGMAYGTTILSSARSAFAVVGRHTQCGIVLPDDPFVALRHLLVRSISTPAGGAVLRVLDLHTDLGIVLANGSRQASIVAEGPVAFSVGEYAIVALPIEVAAQLPDALPPPHIETNNAIREQIAAMEQALGAYRANARPANRHSRITLMPRLVMMGEPIPPRLGRLVSGGAWTITLERGPRSASMSVSEDDLASGVLIGRSEKCHAEVLRRITDTGTSRVHVLVLREGTEVVAYDLASTQGIFVNDRAAHRVVLDDHGTLLTLGFGEKAVRLLWQRATS